jgi:hypothetical protein
MPLLAACSHGPAGRPLVCEGRAEVDRPQAGGYSNSAICTAFSAAPLSS